MNDRNNVDTGGESADEIYRAPASDTRFTPEGDLLSAYIGPKKTEFYAQKFAAFESGGSSVSWNWPAFFLTSMWLLYRKMWLIGLSYWILLPLILSFLSVVVGRLIGPAESVAFYYGSYVLIAFILMPMFANRIYYGHAKRKIAKVALATTSAEQQSAEVARVGGTSNVVLVVMPILLVFIIGVIAAIAVPAYQDYTIRAQVAEGLNLAAGPKLAVVDYYETTNEYPVNNEVAGLPAAERISGNYVAGISVMGPLVEITYGKQSHEIISEKTLLLKVEPQADNTLAWSCSSPSIEPRHLPAACR